jgi:transcriptional regulator with XRE-family HTH domain
MWRAHHRARYLADGNDQAMSRTTDDDVFTGDRIREARFEARKTQTDLALALGVSFQQIQKYERGKNRPSGAQLAMLSRTLDKPLAFFFPQGGAEGSSLSVMNKLMACKEGYHLALLFPALGDDMRRAILEFVKLAAKEQANG